MRRDRAFAAARSRALPDAPPYKSSRKGATMLLLRRVRELVARRKDARRLGSGAAIVAVTHRGPARIVPALRAHNLVDLGLHQLMQHAEPDTHAQGSALAAR